MVCLRYFIAVLMVLLVGCPQGEQPYDNPHAGLGGTGGTPITLTGEGGDLFPPGFAADVPCCVDLAPFQRVSLITSSDTPCPAGSDEGDTLHADFLQPDPHTCSCSCSAPTCTLPGGMHTNAAKCADADGSAQLPFGPAGNGWDGVCSNENPVAAGLPCGGVPCVASVTVPALLVSPCEPDPPVIAKAEATWGHTVRECTLDLPANGCADGQICPPAPPDGFDLCLIGEGDLDCPAGFTKSPFFYTGVKDDRGCGPCSCGDPEAQCEAYVVAYSDAACGMPTGSVMVSAQEPACFDVLSGNALGSAQAYFLGQSPGSCPTSGGETTGGIAPDGLVTLCCQSALDPVW
jgi:hypothetical protein